MRPLARYPKRMGKPGWGAHAAILVALVVNLWVGGDLVEAWLGHAARSVFELALLGAWLVLVVGMRVPLPFRGKHHGGRRDDDDGRP